jgi:hypothetical protein
VWLSTILFAGLGLALLVGLVLLFDRVAFQLAAKPLTLASAVFWGFVAFVALFAFWGLYYRYFYPGWVRWLAPLDVALYALLGMAMWWPARRLPGPSVLWFALLGGLEGVLEHLFGFYLLDILQKVPFLQGLHPGPLLVFSFFEYVFYWSLTAWIGFGFTKLL